MKLEVGKTYKTRGGKLVEITIYDGLDLWPFWGILDGIRCFWNRDGTYSFLVGEVHDNDLIEEITPTPTTRS